jgi:hypothetical protein
MGLAGVLSKSAEHQRAESPGGGARLGSTSSQDPAGERPTVVTQIHACGAAVDNLNRGLMEDYFSDGLPRR